MNSWDDFNFLDNQNNNLYSNSDFSFTKKNVLTNFSLKPQKPVDDEALKKIEDFVNSINKIYTSPKLRVDEKVWRSLLEVPMVESMEYGLYFKKEVLHYFIKHYYLPDNIWDLIDVLFCFSTDYTQEINDYSYSIMLFSLIHNLENLSPLSYDYITDIEDDLFDIYISYREIVYRDLKCGNFTDASINIDLAYDICDCDPELIRLNGDYFYLTQDFEDSVSLYEKCIELNAEDYKAIEKLGKSLYKLERYKEAIPYFLKYIEKFPKKYKIILLIAMCYYRTYDFINSKEYFDILFTKTLKYRCLEAYGKSIKKHLKHNNLKGNLIEDDFDYTLPIEDSPKFKFMYPDGYVTENPRPTFSVNNIALVLLFFMAVTFLMLFIIIISQPVID